MAGARGVELALGIAFGGVELVIGGENIACGQRSKREAGIGKDDGAAGVEEYGGECHG